MNRPRPPSSSSMPVPTESRERVLRPGETLGVAAGKPAIETFLPTDDVTLPWLAAAGQAAVSK